MTMKMSSSNNKNSSFLCAWWLLGCLSIGGGGGGSTTTQAAFASPQLSPRRCPYLVTSSSSSSSSSSHCLLSISTRGGGGGIRIPSLFRTTRRGVSVNSEQEEKVEAVLVDENDTVDNDTVDNEDVDIKDVTMTEEELEFLARTKKLCESRNLKFTHIKNARDLASAGHHYHNPIQPRRLIRMGKVSDASPEDLELLLDEIGVKTLIDLRSPTELKEDENLERPQVYQEFVSIVWTERKNRKNSNKDDLVGCVKELAPGEARIKKNNNNNNNNGEKKTTTTTTRRKAILNKLSNRKNDLLNKLEQLTTWGDDEGKKPLDQLFVAPEGENCDVCDDGYVAAEKILPRSHDERLNRRERHFCSLMNEFKYVRGTIAKLRKRDVARVLLKSPGALISRRVRASCKDVFLDEINDGGLPMLNELLLQYGAPGIRYALELMSDKSRHPVAFYCTAGKDRTGGIAALVLATVGVSDEAIVEDYSLSANVYAEMNDHKAMVGALSQRNLNPKTFLGAPPEVMQQVLNDVRSAYGSVEGYLDFIGFGPEKRKKLIEALTT